MGALGNRRWRWLALALLIGFEAVVVALVLTPQVTPRYRAVFIDRSSDCWPRDVPGWYRMGQRVSFFKADANGAAPYLKRCGWIPPEGTGTWSLGPESRLLFQLPPDQGTLVLELDFLPFVTEQHPLQRVEISANDHLLASLQLTASSPRQHRLLFSPEIIGDDGRVELILEFPDAVAPREIGLGDDRRNLAIRLLFLRVTKQVERGPA